MKFLPANRAAALVLMMASLAGCKALVPYDSQFACAKSQDYGKCMDVQSAYEDAVAAEPATVSRDKGAAKAPKLDYRTRPVASDKTGAKGKSKAAPTGRVTPVEFVPETAMARYRNAQYSEMAQLIESPVTPLVKPPKVLRTLIVSYSAGNSLYMPRFVYYIAEESKFILGDYLKGGQDDRTLFPNGSPVAASR